MKKNMLTYLSLIVATLAAAHASGDFVVLHSPDSVTFSGSEGIVQSLLKEVFTAVLGFTVKQRGTWNGMSITNPFELPEAVVVIAVEGVDSLDVPYGERFPLDVNEVEETTWQGLSSRLFKRDNDNTLVRISLGDGLDALGQSALGELKPTPIDETSLKALSVENEEDLKFLEEVQLLHAIAKKVPSAIKADSKPDVFWLVVSGLRPVVDLHGKNSSAAKEALTLLNNAINVTSEAFIDVYDGKVVIAAFTNNASQARHTRSVPVKREADDTDEDKAKSIETDAQRVHNDTEKHTETSDNKIMNKQGDNADTNTNIEDEEAGNIITTTNIANDSETTTANIEISDDSGVTEKSTQDDTKMEHKTNTKKLGQGDLNLSKEYSEDYPVIFNILLWFGVVFFFSLLAICIAIADMDPGRDSIIYRMTSNRMKKDN